MIIVMLLNLRGSLELWANCRVDHRYFFTHRFNSATYDIKTYNCKWNGKAQLGRLYYFLLVFKWAVLYINNREK